MDALQGATLAQIEGGGMVIRQSSSGGGDSMYGVGIQGEDGWFYYVVGVNVFPISVTELEAMYK